MGIPSFYRWLIERYPRTVVDAVEEAAGDGGSPIDTSRPNPNGLEYDNLYLDMNGIIHPCFHPEGLPAPKTHDEVFRAVFKYIDKIFSIVRPRKLLFLAVDGVAPRAKMNQQRSRRFRAAKDVADEATQKEMSGNVCELKEERFTSLEHSSELDSNVITPGTEFMWLLSSALRYYIQLKMNVDLGWRGLKVILSDASVPGEGEHKIMSYIRLQRNLPGFDPNTRHCLYGLDADLIMLALATHEIHFSILREDVQLRRRNSNRSSKFARNSSLMGRGHVRRSLEQMESVSENLEDYISRQRLQFLNIWVLREYLALDMKTTDPKLEGDLERFIDDFVFMCLFVGNDFLPHIPSLEISEGAIDLLMMTYKREFQSMGGYLTNSFEVNLERVQIFIETLGQYECGIFNKRLQLQKQREAHNQRSSKNKFVSNFSTKLKKAQVGQDPTNPSAMEIQAPINSACSGLGTVVDKPSAMEIQAPNNSACSGLDTVVDNIKFGEEGWKRRYYAEKFGVETGSDFEKTRKHLVLKYIEGICWVMHYYYEGVCSWQWFYPYHYAPLATDFYDIGVLKIQFTLGEPFKPFDQLMAVLPAARKLMTDKLSPLLDFYPTDFELDMNGKRFSWQAICKLPFIEESRLLSEIARVEHTLTDEERHRNNLGLDILFVHMSHRLAVKIVSFSRENTSPLEIPKSEVKQEIDPNVSGGMNGYMVISDKPVQPAQIYSPIEGMEIISNNEVLSIFYKYPPFHAHIPRPPEGVSLPGKSIGKRDKLPPLILWHQKTAIIGRILFKRHPFPNSICGPPLAKLAHELVSKYYRAKPQKTVVCKRQIGHVSADGITSCTKSQKRRRERKRSKANGMPGNYIGRDGMECLNSGEAISLVGTESNDGNCISGIKILDSHVAEDGRKQTEGSGIPDPHVGVDGLACDSNLEKAICLGGAEYEKVVDSQKKKRRRKSRKGNGIPEANVGGDGLTCLSMKEAISVVGTESNRNCIDGYMILDNHVTEDGQKKTEGIGIPDDLVGANGLAGAECEKVVESRKKKRRRKHNKGNDIPDNNVGGDGSACINMREEIHDNRVLDKHVAEDEKKQTLGSGPLGDNERRDGLECSSMREAVSVVGTESNRGCIDGYTILDNHVTGDARKKTEGIGTPDDHVGANGLACDSNLGVQMCLAGSEGEKVVESKKKKRKRKHNKGNGIPDNNVGGDGSACSNMREEISVVGPESNGDEIHVSRVLDNHVAEDEKKQGLGSGLLDDNERRDGLACSSMREAISFVGTESNRDCIDGYRILDNHVTGDVRKKTEGMSIPDDHVGANGLACDSNLEEKMCLAGSEGEKVVESKKKKRKRKHNKGNGIPDNNVGGDGSACSNMREEISVVGPESNGDEIHVSRVLDNHVAEDEKKQGLGSGPLDDNERRDGLACSSMREAISFVGTESNRDCIDGYRILDNHVTGDVRKKTEGISIPDDHIGANGLACDSNLEEKMCLAGAEGEKVVESKKKKRRRKHNKGNGIPDNNVGGDGSACSNIREEISVVGPESNGDEIHGNRVLDNHVAEDEKKQGLGSGPLDDNKGGDGLACNSNLEERNCLAGNEGEEKVVESPKKKRRRKRSKGNGIPDNYVVGLACLNMSEQLINAVGTHSNGNKIDGNRVLDNHVAQDEKNRTKGSDASDDHEGANGLACQSNLIGNCFAQISGSKFVAPESQNQEGNEGNGLCLNSREEFTVVWTIGDKILDDHVSGDGKTQTKGNGIPDDHASAHRLACHLNLEERNSFGNAEGEIAVVVESRKKRRKRKRGKGNNVPDNHVAEDGQVCGLNSVEMVSSRDGTGTGGDDGGSGKTEEEEKKGKASGLLHEVGGLEVLEP